MIRRKQHRVCYYISDRAIVLEEEPMSSNRHRSSPLVDMNTYKPDEDAPPKGAAVSPAQKAVEEIRRHVGIIERALVQADLNKAHEERIEELQRQFSDAVTRASEMTQWLDMIREALKQHDSGELNPRQFANEVEAAIKGWEAA